jgi:uncharacterized protein YjiS (DUF1127 family)
MSKLISSYDLKNNTAFRDSYIVIAIVEALAGLYVSFKQWRGRRRTLKALAELNEHQLLDIGLTPGDAVSWRQAPDKRPRALAAIDDSDLTCLSDVGRRMRRQARHGGSDSRCP